MQIVFIQVGKTNVSYLIEGENEFDARLKHYIKFENCIIPELKKAKSLNENQIKDQEGKLILAKTEKSDFVVLLDDKGDELTSKKMSVWLQKRMNSGLKRLVFVVGGAYGFSDEVYQRSNQKLSLSKMTFTHQMVRLIFKEQVYRGFTIIKGEPYHHE